MRIGGVWKGESCLFSSDLLKISHSNAGGSAHINNLLSSWTMQTKLGSTSCYKSHIQIPCRRNIASIAISYIPIAQILHNLCAWLHDLEGHK